MSLKRPFSLELNNSDEWQEAFLLEMEGNRETENSICNQNINGQKNMGDKNRSKDDKNLICKNKNCLIDKTSCC